MAGLPDPVAKETILKRLDAFSANLANLQAALNDLHNAALPLVDVAVNHLALNEAEGNHLRDWFEQRRGEENRFRRSPTQPSVENKVRQGLIEACELALESKFPIDSWWIRPGYIRSVFVEAFVNEGDRNEQNPDLQRRVITLNIYTPTADPNQLGSE